MAWLFSLGFLWSIFSLAGTLVSLAFLLSRLFLMYKAYSKEMFMIPVIGETSSKQAEKQAQVFRIDGCNWRPKRDSGVRPSAANRCPRIVAIS